jgi:hypothetical protein
MMEAARSFETLVNFYLTTLRYNPEDSHLRLPVEIPEFQITVGECEKCQNPHQLSL